MHIKEQIRRGLSAIQPRMLTKGFARQAAVLMPVFEWNGEPHFLLTRRTDEVQTHKGQISFPGGMQEGEETLERTALRETFEEVGIPEERIEILGQFHDYLSITEYRVTSYAAYLQEPFTVRPQPSEVAEVLRVPFHTFFDPGRLRIEKAVIARQEVDVYYYSHNGHEIWGLTARIIREFLETLNLRPEHRTPHAF